MQKPSTPSDDSERLAALHAIGILDTASDERFDVLTRLAQRLLDVPIALVSLVDEERQWFKSRLGVTVSEAPRDTSFCGHAIQKEDVFCIPDATEDERFHDNPMVTGEPHIRSYAGCPIRSIDGYKLGTLCIIDKVPRHLNAEQFDDMRDLAALAAREIQAIELAKSDELTGLPNRRGFMLSAEQSLNVCRRAGVPVTLMYLDLDNFKAINDNYGHAVGDAALQRFAWALNDIRRGSDAVGRLGGDEFVVLLTGTSERAAERYLERLSHALAPTASEHVEAMPTSWSVGVVAFDSDRHNAIEDLLQEADKRMYQGKADRVGAAES